MKDNKKVMVISVVAVILLILIAIGVTYAFFLNQIENNANIDIKTEVTDATKVEYTPDDDLMLINAEPGSKAETTFSISLTSSNMTADTVTYGIDWKIDYNEFVYEPENATDPQLVYSIYYSDDNTNWRALKENVDCTTATGTITLAEGQTISAEVSQTKTVYWKLSLEYKSYDYNQATNMSKNLSGKITVTGLD